MRDLELVKFALSNLNAKQMHSISDSFSPTFTFSTPRFKSLNFEQYCEYIEFVSSLLEGKIEDISEDNGLFTINMGFNIVDNQSNYQKVLPTIGKMVVKNHQIQSLIISYDANSLDLKIIMKIATAIIKHLKNLALSK